MVKSIALLSNVTMGVLATELATQYQIYVPEGFDTWRIEVLNDASGLMSQTHDLTFFLFYADAWRDNWHNSAEGLAFIQEVERDLDVYLRKRPMERIVITTLDFHTMQIDDIFQDVGVTLSWQFAWLQMLMRLKKEHANLVIYDWCKSIQEIGTDKFYSSKMWYSASMPFTMPGIRKIADDIGMFMRAIGKERKKCLVLDLDNTLWGGVAGEGNIALDDHYEGKIYSDFQRQLKQIKEQGVILTILSKNNFSDVESILIDHPQMLLHLQDFASYRINWGEKYENIKDLASELNIGLDSMVFIDDNPAEREAMRQFCPEVTVPDFPQNIVSLPEWAVKLYKEYFFSTDITAEDLLKTEMYQQEHERRVVQAGSRTLIEYLTKLEIEIEIHRMQRGEITRVSQLCMKTNQFNLTTKRYTEMEIMQMSQKDEYDLFTVHTLDRFGDNGLVSVIICHHSDGIVEIDTFLMSCRVMGRKIEDVIVSKLVEWYRPNYDALVGRYFETPKNQPVKELYTRMGFCTNNGQDFIFSLKDNAALSIPNCFKSIHFSGRKTNAN